MTYKLEIHCADGMIYDIDNATYECDGLLLIVNQGDDQFVFAMEYINYFKAERRPE